GTALQSLSRWQSARSHRPLGTPTETVFGNSPACMPFGKRSVRRGNCQLARAKADPSPANANFERRPLNRKLRVCYHSRLDNALLVKLRDPVCIVAEDLAIDALVVLSQLGRPLIESGRGLRKPYRQSHGVNAIGRPVF